MKAVLAALLLPAASALAADAGAAPPGELAIGDPAPDFELVGVDEETHRLQDFAGADWLLVAFLSNHCPTSQAVETRLKRFAADYRAQGLRVVAINPNDPAALRPDELGYSRYSDSFPEMKRHAREQAFNFPYLYDGDAQAAARAYGCLATPQVFLFDSARRLRYRGRFDDSRFADPASVTRPDARLALEALLAGQPVPAAVTKPHGCSVKWRSKRAEVAEDNRRWTEGAVEVGLIDAAGVAALRRNATGKLRLFNVWATWCGPCVREFPELVATSRRFGLRDFEFISISLDDPKNVAEVKAFLEKHDAVVPARLLPGLQAEGRRGNAYVFKESNSDALIQALDPEWPGPIPHTLLVAPGGEVIYRHNGGVDGDELRARILEHLGRFYTPAP